MRPAHQLAAGRPGPRSTVHVGKILIMISLQLQLVHVGIPEFLLTSHEVDFFSSLRRSGLPGPGPPGENVAVPGSESTRSTRGRVTLMQSTSLQDNEINM